MRRLMLLVALSLALVSLPPAHAWSAADPSGGSDDSVCDFGGYAVKWIQINLLRGQSAPPETFAAAALRHAAQVCKNGQILILNDPVGTYGVDQTFDRIAAALCLRADFKQASRGEFHHELRCTITKLHELRAQ